MYPFHLTDSEWQVIGPYLNNKRKRKYSLRLILDAIFYVLKTGCQWRSLPYFYPPYRLVYYYLQRFSALGYLKQWNWRLNLKRRKLEGHAVLPSIAFLDAQAVKNCLWGADNPGFDGYKKVFGYKRHIICDSLGLIHEAGYSNARQHDSQPAKGLIEKLARQPFSRIQHLQADQAYLGLRKQCQQLGWQLDISGRIRQAKEGFILERQRWKVERVFGWMSFSRRLTRNYERKEQIAIAWIYLFNIRRCIKALAYP